MFQSYQTVLNTNFFFLLIFKIEFMRKILLLSINYLPIVYKNLYLSKDINILNTSLMDRGSYKSSKFNNLIINVFLHPFLQE